METLVKILRKPVTSTLIAVLFGFLVAAIVLILAGYNPIQAFGTLFNEILSKSKYISNVIVKATPIILTGLSVALAYRTDLFNIGAKRQYIIGTVFSVLVDVKLDLTPVFQIPIVVLAGVLGGTLFGGMVGLLRARFRIHEVITSIMLNWIGLYFCNFIVSSEAYHKLNSTASPPVDASDYTMLLPRWRASPEGIAVLKPHQWLYDMLVRTDVNFEILITIVIVAVIWILLCCSTKGYELRTVSFNRDAAGFSDININRNIIDAMLIAGALSGLAGALAIAGTAPHGISTLAAFGNNSFNGLSVALIAGFSPVGCVLAGLLLDGLLYGGQNVQRVVGAPTEIINIMIGTIVSFVALTRIVLVLADELGKRGAEHAN